MSDEKLLQYFIETTNQRLTEIDKKLDLLINFRIMLVTGAAVVSGIVSLIFQIVMK